jgi:type I restriction enzyme S subunit
MKATARQDQIDDLSLKEGDVLITKDSESPDDIAVPAYVPSSLPGVVCGYHLAHVRPYQKHANGNYLFRSFSAHGISDQFEISANGVTRFGIGKQTIDNSVFLSPPLAEQTAIAVYLDRKTAQIDDLISKKQKLIELLKEERAAIINQAVTKGLNPDAPMKESRIEWLGEVPAHWEVMRLKYVAKTVQTGTTPSSLKPEYFIDGEIDWFTPVDFGDSLFLSNSNRKLNRLAIDDNVARLYRSNTVLLVGIGATLGKIGIIKRTASSNQQINAISFKDNYNPDFGAYYFQAISDVIVSMSNAATLPILNQTQTKEIMTPVPHQKEQDEIVGFVNQATTKIDQTISKINNQIDLLQEYCTTLISEVVTGKIDVRA